MGHNKIAPTQTKQERMSWWVAGARVGSGKLPVLALRRGGVRLGVVAGAAATASTRAIRAFTSFPSDTPVDALVARVQEELAAIYPRAQQVHDGAQASYIPELEKVNPELFAIALCGPNGHFWSIGDATIPFTLQSCVKPILYNVALDLAGERVHDHIGHEPSGKRFNAFELDENHKPHNPMINSGAIMASALIRSQFTQKAEPYNALQAFTERAIGKMSPVNFNNSVYLSELGHAARNYALTYFMQEHSELLKHTSVEEVLHLYFQACSMSTDVRGLAVLAATYAMGGMCPITNERVMDPHHAQAALSLMYNCGMYDYSGRFAFEVGIPAKSGVSGALFLSVPGKLGIAIYSPRVDALGNTVRGLYVAAQLVRAIPELHVFSTTRLTHEMDVPKAGDTEHLHLMLMQFVAHGDAAKVHELVSNTSVNVNGTNPDGRTALLEALAAGRGDIASYLLAHGADPAVTDHFGNTPMSEAERHNLQHILDPTGTNFNNDNYNNDDSTTTTTSSSSVDEVDSTNGGDVSGDGDGDGEETAKW
ncbi:glutaminase [Salpingoeca rosetta]|uniref:glutaminase n=1 Tax=Salpingoeca rosetta (strain ATCC 50818 / BSB-021) TaxID=946362 RepID=F2U7J0_SALR5|nr:glutaminase [Salpingoeca rosetta]EGD83407.1 glutaminase [Salpingoeca rosetta]|eukprot:XP_004994911.1 glutaminase [Salpingoeca rosetta]